MPANQGENATKRNGSARARSTRCNDAQQSKLRRENFPGAIQNERNFLNEFGACAKFAMTDSRTVQVRRLSRNTACSPNRFQNHHGAAKRIGAPEACSASARSISAPVISHSSRKSLIVQK